MKKIKILVFVALLLSCTPQKRLNKLIKKHPELVKVDTVFIKDTIVIENAKVDTVVNFKTLNLYDTIVLTKDRLMIEIIKSYDTIKVKGECLGDTIYYTKEVPVERVTVIEKKWNFKKIFTVSILSLLALIILIKTK